MTSAGLGLSGQSGHMVVDGLWFYGVFFVVVLGDDLIMQLGGSIVSNYGINRMAVTSVIAVEQTLKRILMSTMQIFC